MGTVSKTRAGLIVAQTIGAGGPCDVDAQCASRPVLRVQGRRWVRAGVHPRHLLDRLPERVLRHGRGLHRICAAAAHRRRGRRGAARRRCRPEPAVPAGLRERNARLPGWVHLRKFSRGRQRRLPAGCARCLPARRDGRFGRQLPKRLWRVRQQPVRQRLLRARRDQRPLRRQLPAAAHVPGRARRARASAPARFAWLLAPPPCPARRIRRPHAGAASPADAGVDAGLPVLSGDVNQTYCAPR